MLDFGIVKVLEHALMLDSGSGAETNTGAVLGTPHYMSPEQAMSEKDIDGRADIWALGVMLFECLAGARPLQFDTFGQMYQRFLSAEVPSLADKDATLPDDVTAAVDACLVVKREGRLSELADLIEVLERHAGASAIPAPLSRDSAANRNSTAPSAASTGASTGEKSFSSENIAIPKEPNRLPWLVAAVACLGVGAFAWQQRGAAPAEAPAEAPQPAASPVASWAPAPASQGLATPPTETAKAVASALASAPPPAVPTARPVSAPKTKPEPKTPNCSPGYRIGTKGEKIWKPECLWTRLSVILVASLAWPAVASAEQQLPAEETDSKQICIDAHAATQTLRTDGKLVEARNQAVRCSQADCPEKLQGECATFVQELDAAIPTIQLAVTGVDGQRTTDIELTIDGAAHTYEGRSIPLDPGKHVLVIVHSGETKTVEVATVEGTKTQPVEVTFEKAPEPEPVVVPPPVPPTRTVAPPPPRVDTGREVGLSPLVGIGFALGGAGLVTFAVAGAITLSRLGDLNDACPEDASGVKQCPADQADALSDGELSAHVTSAGLAIGIVGIGLGIIGLLISGGERGDASAWNVGPDGWSVRF